MTIHSRKNYTKWDLAKQILAHHAFRTPRAPTYMHSGMSDVHSATRAQCQYSPYSPNYRQEGYIFKQELKKLYKHCAMEKSSSRSYIPGKKSASLYRKTSEFN